MLIVRALWARPRLLAALLAMAMVALVVPRTPSRLLIAWDAGTIVYLILMFAMILRSDINQMRRRAPTQDEGAFFVLVVVVLTSVASLAAIWLELHDVGDVDGKGPGLVLAGVTVLCSWCFVNTSFALHYAHEYYGDGRDRQTGGLRFPEPGFPEPDPGPDYWDFLYFAANIGAAAQTSDVAITSRSLRRVVLAHTILSFFFNTTILALAVNVGASAV